MTPRTKTVSLLAAAALAAGAYGAVGTASAGNRAVALVRRTVSCATELRALQISAFASNPSIGSANVSITTGDPQTADGLLGMSNEQPQYGLSSRCHAVSKTVSLTHRGLTSAGVVHAGDIRYPTAYCAATSRVLLRFVIGLNSSGKPVSATVAAWTQPKAGKKAKSKPIGFVHWSPARSVTYYRAGCTTQDQ